MNIITRLLNKYFINNYKKKFVKLLDKQEIPKNASDWRVRSGTCNELIKKIQSTLVNKKEWEKNDDELKISALEIISNESLEISKIKELESQKNKLNEFTDLKGYDVYRQIGGKELATKVLFYKNKSKIIVETKKGDMIFEVRGDGVGRWYTCKFNKLNYEITLGKKSPEEILIETFEGNNLENCIDNFVIKLEKIK